MINIPLESLGIDIYDINDDRSTIIWKTNTTGNWTTIDKLINKENGSYNTSNTSWINSYNTKYWWSINATDPLGSGNWTNTTYSFTTRPENYPPILSNPVPINDDQHIPLGMINLQITANDPDNELMNITFRTNTSGSWYDIGSNLSVPNGTYSQWYFLDQANHLYYWSVNCSDGKEWKNTTFHFTTRLCISGIYPHLAMFNGGSSECGIGAVAPWANKLWVMTYPAHSTTGSSDKLYEIDNTLHQTIRPESVGGTHACRLIHDESNQLIIGPYFIDENGSVRTVDLNQLVGRMTGIASHLSDPENKVYFYDMEEKFYEVNVSSLGVTKLYDNIGVPGTHGKGAYSSQGRVVISNNGGGGALAEWDGQNWSTIENVQFTEVTGPWGISGPSDDNSSLFATGWDKRSCILKLFENGTWFTYRFPIASYTYVSDNGWYTEWPRIHGINNDILLMTMHGMLYKLPRMFGTQNTSNFYPLTTYLRMIVDFCQWDDQLVIASNDNSMFDNPLAGQPQSNLLFLNHQNLSDFGGPATSYGGSWVSDSVIENMISDPFLINGYTHRVLHLYVSSIENANNVTISLEIDENGIGTWKFYEEINMTNGEYTYWIFPDNFTASWIRLNTSNNCEITAYFHLSSPNTRTLAPECFSQLSDINNDESYCKGILLPHSTQRDLQFVSNVTFTNGSVSKSILLDIDQELTFQKAVDQSRINSILNTAQIDPHFTVDNASVIINYDGINYRLPKTYSIYDDLLYSACPRSKREVVTERNLMHIHGTFYELPRDLASGINGIRPISTHGKYIYDFCSWRGMLVLSGTKIDVDSDGHYFHSDENQSFGLWFGAVDDLWKLGEPWGVGGPWNNTFVLDNTPSDPYLMTGYTHKQVDLSHDKDTNVTFRLQVQFIPNGPWVVYNTISVPPNEILTHTFQDGYSALWIRLISNDSCHASVIFHYGQKPVDVTPPIIENVHISPSIASVGESINITCNVTDDVSVNVVRVNITDPTGNCVNVTMLDVGYYWNNTYSDPGIYSFFIWANDTSNNSAMSSTYTFDIIEENMVTTVCIIPETQNVSVGEPFTVSVYCQPTVPIEGFEFDLSYNASLIHATSVIKGDIFAGFDTFFSNGSIDNILGYINNVYELIIEEGNVSDSGYLANISFIAQNEINTSPLLLVDVGVANESGYVEIRVVNGSVTVAFMDDNILPEITNVSCLSSLPRDTLIGWVNISSTVIDNIEVDQVYLNITYPDLHSENMVMMQSGDMYYFNSTLSTNGTYSYFIWANDTSDNLNSSSSQIFELPPNWDVLIDHDCNILDLIQVANHFDEAGIAGWIRADVNNDGQVSIVDLIQIANHFDETW